MRKDSGNDHQIARVAGKQIWFLDKVDKMYPFSGKSFVRNVQEKRSRKSRQFCPLCPNFKSQSCIQSPPHAADPEKRNEKTAHPFIPVEPSPTANDRSSKDSSVCLGDLFMPKSASRDTPLAHSRTAKWDTSRAREKFSCSRTLMGKNLQNLPDNYPKNQNLFQLCVQ